MNDAQIWTALGILAAAFTAMITLASTTFVRILRAELGSAIGSLEGRMNARFERIEVRLDSLDRDVTALVKDRFGFDRGEA